MKIKFQWPIIIIKGWKGRMKEAARNGYPILAIKEIKLGFNIGLKEAKELWDTKYKQKYYKPNNKNNGN